MATRKTKGEKIKGLAKIIHTRTACVGCMAWESPFILFKLVGTNRTVEWQTDDESWLYREGDVVHLEAFYYERTDSIRRVKITEINDQETFAKIIMQDILDHYVTAKESDDQKIDCSLNDDAMDARSCFVALRDGDFDRAAELALYIDGDILVKIQRLISLGADCVDQDEVSK